MPIPGATTLAFTNPQKDEGDWVTQLYGEA
jgi:hypothetical protein